jgi:phage terminase Nu1 subunit (DNA packaging protein)
MGTKPQPVRDRLIEAQAQRVELLNRKTAAELIPAELVEAEWEDIVARIKTRLLAIPARVAAAHPGNRPIIETLERELTAALAAIADDEL